MYKFLINSLHKSEKYLVFLIYCALFLAFIPPFYLIPFIHSNILSSHTLVRLITIILFCFIIALSLFENRVGKIDKSFGLVIIIFLFSQSLSILGADDIPAFMTTYTNMVFGLAFFLVCFYFVKAQKTMRRIMYTFITAGTVNVIFELLVYFFPDWIYTYIQPIINERYWDFFDYQFQRQRFFGDVFVEIIAPFVTYLFFTNKKRFIKTSSFLLILLVTFLAVVSNWRSKFGMLIFSLATAIFIYRKSINHIALGAILVLFLTFLLGYTVSVNLVGLNTIDRFLVSDIEDIKTIESRFSFWQEAIIMFLNSPLIGVGLGNYFYNLPMSMQIENRNSYLQPASGLIIIDDPHNIFISLLASTGIFGFLSFLFLIFFFLKQDLYKLKKSSALSSKPTYPLILSFWTLFLYSIFNPAIYFQYQFIFWALRGVIYNL